MKIGALAPWFGSKRTLAPAIVEQLGQHSCYWEPFCGSCAVLFAKEPCRAEGVNDLHADLINLAMVVQGEGTARLLYARVVGTLFHEDLLPIAKAFLSAEIDTDLSLERAYWYLVFSWMGMNGVSGTPIGKGKQNIAARYTNGGGNPVTRWRSVVESIPDWHQRLLGVQILHKDAFKVLEKIYDEPGTALYIDPPYIAKSTEYVHDLDSDGHRRLADALSRFKQARVVLSYYEHPLLAELYPEWSKKDCTMAKAMSQGSKRDQKGKTESPEVLLCNGPLVGSHASLFA